jgi:hypothetical protein
MTGAAIFATWPGMDSKLLSCPRCGLVLKLVDDDRFTYDVGEWRRRCEGADLARSPVTCIFPGDTRDQGDPDPDDGTGGAPK